LEEVLSVKWKFYKLFAYAFVGIALCISAKGLAVVWEEQATRLQNVNASLLDSSPMPRPTSKGYHLGVFSNIAVLPKVNPQVGGKIEKTPSSPIHSIPSVEFNAGFALASGKLIDVGLYAGYLPSFFGSIVGLKAELNQFQVGPHVGFQTDLFRKKVDLNLGVSYHYTSGTLKGKIASKEEIDTFIVTTSYMSFYTLFQVRPWKSWLGIQISQKKTDSTFEIVEDKTKITLSDSLQKDSIAPFVTQIWIGTKPISGLWFQAGYTFIPTRAYLPRIGVGYTYTFGAKHKKKSEEPKPKEEPIKVQPKKQKKKGVGK
jgi:hypothetical protein